STTVECDLGSSGRATWCYGRPRSATRPDPVESWRRTGKDPTEWWMLSEKRLTHWQWRKGECYREPGTFQTFKKFIHNVKKVL
ncbi:hypothetical protein BHE74_00049822, partial [Ensete ventricosum]